jgi:hypothetical protein
MMLTVSGETMWVPLMTAQCHFSVVLVKEEMFSMELGELFVTCSGSMEPNVWDCGNARIYDEFPDRGNCADFSNGQEIAICDRWWTI